MTEIWGSPKFCVTPSDIPRFGSGFAGLQYYGQKYARPSRIFPPRFVSRWHISELSILPGGVRSHGHNSKSFTEATSTCCSPLSSPLSPRQISTILCSALANPPLWTRLGRRSNCGGIESRADPPVRYCRAIRWSQRRRSLDYGFPTRRCREGDLDQSKKLCSAPAHPPL
jgi:hypothetical protein